MRNPIQTATPLQLVTANALHIDTVRLSHAYPFASLPSPDELIERGFDIGKITSTESSGCIITANFQSLNKKSHSPRITVSHSDYGYCGIKIEVSIAKLLDGNGLGRQTNEDMDCALDAIEDNIRQHTGVEFDARTAKVGRLDANADFQVGEDQVRLYIQAMSCRCSRMIQGTVGATTKQYHNRSRTLLAYGKLEEMKKRYNERAATWKDVEAAKGILRVESRLQGSATVKRLAEKLQVQADAKHLLTMSVAKHIVNTALVDLRLVTPKPSSQTCDKLLLEHFGKQAPEMFGILTWRTRYGEDFWKQIGWSQAKYYRIKKRLLEANIWDLSPTDSLPALAVTPDAYNNSTSLSYLRIEPENITTQSSVT